LANEYCAEEKPVFREAFPEHFVACHAVDPSKIEIDDRWKKYQKEVMKKSK
jgi:hypothetical protein